MKNISDDDTHHPPPSKNLQASSLGLRNIHQDENHDDEQDENHMDDQEDHS